MLLVKNLHYLSNQADIKAISLHLSIPVLAKFHDDGGKLLIPQMVF